MSHGVIGGRLQNFLEERYGAIILPLLEVRLGLGEFGRWLGNLRQSDAGKPAKKQRGSQIPLHLS